MSSREELDDDLSGSDDEPEDEERTRPSGRSRSRPPPRRTRHVRPVRRWRSGDDEPEDEDEELPPTGRRRHLLSREDHPVYWRARDSLYFEPLVAVAIVVVLIAGLYAYTQNWPPVYVVESDSMQHGSTDVLGLINTGDLVLAERLPASQVTPYVVGVRTGYSTYGEYGDVLLYLPNGQGSTPIIHRAILFLDWDSAISAYNATDLLGLPCGTAAHAVYATPGTPNDCGVTGLVGTLDLYGIGWRSANVSVDLASPLLGDHSGFLTLGDNNFVSGSCASSSGCVGYPDQNAGLSELVESGWIVGVARGMIPWFGALKLALEGNSQQVPAQSWQFLGLTIAGLILLAFGIHYALRAEGIEDPRRLEEEAEEESRDADLDEEPRESRSRRFLHSLRPWRRSEEEEDEIEGPPRKPAPRSKATRRGHRGRPPPRVRRGEKRKRSASRSEDNDL